MSLDEEFRQVCLDLQMLMHGSITNYHGAGSGGIPDTKPPTGENDPPHLRWLAEWNRAETPRRRERVLEMAIKDRDSYLKRKVGKVVEETEQELKDRIVKEGVGWGLSEIARHCRVTDKFARQARQQGGVSVATGKPPAGVHLETDSQRDRAVQLGENGYTERQIVMLTKLPKSTIRRVLGRAA